MTTKADRSLIVKQLIFYLLIFLPKVQESRLSGGNAGSKKPEVDLNNNKPRWRIGEWFQTFPGLWTQERVPVSSTYHLGGQDIQMSEESYFRRTCSGFFC